jgi:integrase/recombinase XerD
MTSLAPHIEAFLREYLVRHRGASQHTCDSYSYSFQSLFEFASRKLKVAPSALMLEQLDAALISTFLEHLETHTGQLSGDAKHPLGCPAVVLPVSAAP